MNKDKNKHGVYIPADLWEQLKAFCEKHYNVSCSAVICRAIEEFIAVEEIKESPLWNCCCVPPKETQVKEIEEKFGVNFPKR